jgi:hypothetical protein
VDFAFHVGGRLHVFHLGGTTRLPSQRRYLHELTGQGVRVVDLAADDWGRPGLLSRLGPGFADPFDFPGLPQSPFRPRALRKPMPAEA